MHLTVLQQPLEIIVLSLKGKSDGVGSWCSLTCLPDFPEPGGRRASQLFHRAEPSETPCEPSSSSCAILQEGT